MGSGIYKALAAGILERLKYPPQLYSKQVEFAQGFQTKFEVTVKTTWSMWTLFKTYVNTGVTFEELSIKDNEFYSEWGIVYPYIDPGQIIRVKSCTVEADDMELSFITDNDDKYTVDSTSIYVILDSGNTNLGHGAKTICKKVVFHYQQPPSR
ncbi:hypothetical protein CDAR_23481 [Caerostris darwini]|uniref:Uncharacterized protein n=1 Tax=Caerostris darwini TaxID=1538125 RepID=A0AAV4T820_9ARAC|nr:hypothetical protein CDAR_23481 [Caerostris darwini]